MCGRYASSVNPDDLAAHFSVAEPPEQTLAPSYNVAPTDPVYVVLVRHDTRQLKVVRWGLIPSWSKEAKVGGRFINARRESVRAKPAFRAAFQRRRCLVPADGYYEWQNVGAAKQPYFLAAQDRSPLAMAGLYELWRAPDESLVWTCTVITTEAADDLGHIHDRTPLLVPRDAWNRWLDPTVEDPGDDLLVPGTAGVLDAWPVSTDVGSVRNNDRRLVAPAELPEQPRLL
ncbi:MAG: SOS response-associated peptidase [Mycobacteriales bacterium]